MNATLWILQALLAAEFVADAGDAAPRFGAGLAHAAELTPWHSIRC